MADIRYFIYKFKLYKFQIISFNTKIISGYNQFTS